MRRRRRRSKAWVAVMLLVLLALVAAILFRYVFVVRNVEIIGERDVPDEAVIRASRVGLGASIFFVDEERMRAGVNALGTIELEAVELRYPNTVRMQVRQRQARAMLLHMGDICMLDGECCVVQTASAVPDTDLIYINGMTVTGYGPGEPLQAGAGQVEAYCAIMSALEESAAYSYVSEIDLGDVEQLKIITRTGITVELGDAQNMGNKIAWMRSAVADLEMRNEGGGTLDVRSGNKADYNRGGYASVATPAPAAATAAPAG